MTSCGPPKLAAPPTYTGPSKMTKGGAIRKVGVDNVKEAFESTRRPRSNDVMKKQKEGGGKGTLTLQGNRMAGE